MFASAAQAANPVGIWWTEDHSGIIDIKPCAAGLCGTIVGQDNPRKPDGTLPRDWRGDVECGLEILEAHATENPELWMGKILNPHTGQSWHCEIYVDAQGQLRLRGYVLTPLLGETQTWPKFNGQVSEACDIEAPPG